MTQNDRVAAYLLSHQGATTMEVAIGVHPWVSNVRARVSELRKAGYHVEPRKRPDGRTGFYITDPDDLTVSGESVA